MFSTFDMTRHGRNLMSNEILENVLIGMLIRTKSYKSPLAHDAVTKDVAPARTNDNKETIPAG